MCSKNNEGMVLLSGELEGPSYFKIWGSKFSCTTFGLGYLALWAGVCVFCIAWE
jgi:hypothetical protein